MFEGSISMMHTLYTHSLASRGPTVSANCIADLERIWIARRNNGSAHERIRFGPAQRHRIHTDLSRIRG